jgi:hypothetical protein
MYHTLAFYKSMTAGSTNEDVTAVTDQVVTSPQGHFLRSQEYRIFAAVALGATITRARYNTPSLRLPFLPQLCPLEVGGNFGDFPNINEYKDRELRIAVGDELAVETSNSAAGSENHLVAVWTRTATVPAPPGPKYTTRFTSAITASAGTWQSGAITITDTLPGGTYAVIGMDVFGANLALARLVFGTQIERPGVICRQAQSNRRDPTFRDGRVGQFGTFNYLALPQLEVLSTGANSSQTGYLDLIRISA